MIKEIEVGGVKHGVTLADEAVGDGLKRGDKGELSVAVSSGIAIDGEHRVALKYGTGLKIGGDGTVFVENTGGGSSGESMIKVEEGIGDGKLIIGTSGIAIGTDPILSKRNQFSIVKEDYEGNNIRLRVGSKILAVNDELSFRIVGPYSPGVIGLRVGSVVDDETYIGANMYIGTDLSFGEDKKNRIIMNHNGVIFSYMVGDVRYEATLPVTKV